MKNFFLTAATALFFLASCSNDQNDASSYESTQTVRDSAPSQFQKNGKVINVALKQAYEDMLLSQSYIDFESAITDFADKLNFDGNVSDIDTESKMLNWISNNIGKTTFIDYNEAENLWNGVVQKSNIAYDLNSTFLSEFRNSRPGDFATILTPEPIYVGNSCEDDCADSRKTCLGAVNAAYEASMLAAESSLYGPIIRASARLTAYLAAKACHASYGLCVGDC